MCARHSVPCRYQTSSSHPSFYIVAVIGFNQTAYTVGEGDATVEVCATFLEPADPN